MSLKSINPTTNEIMEELSEHTEDDIRLAMENASHSFTLWSKTSFSERSKLMFNAAKLLENRKEMLADIMRLEMGKVKREGLAEIEKCALACKYYAENAESMLQNEPLDVEEGNVYIAWDPIGTILAIMPWNFPFWQVFRFAAPNLMAGNTGILKHASNVPQCAIAIENIFIDAGFPKGVFQSLLIGSKKVNLLIDDDRIKAVTLTGSEKAGSLVAERAGKNIKKTVLELGGSDPFIVLEDADLEHCASEAVKARMINCGQSCIAAKRFIVVKEVAERFLSLFKEKMGALVIGDPENEKVDYGPLARTDLAEGLWQQVEQSIQMGAKVILGGQKHELGGAYFQPTILTDLKPGMPAYEEELFGPVASVIIVNDENEAIETANGVKYGLGGSVWTKDIQRAEKIARKIDSGAVYINKMVASHPSVPFGGVKVSGYGRELSALGIKEFMNAKTVWIGQ